MPANLKNSAVATGLEKVSFHPNPKERRCQRMLRLPHISPYYSSHTVAKWCSKLSKPGFNSMWTVNFQMFKVDLEKEEEPEIKLPTSVGLSKKQERSSKTSTSALLTTPKPLTVWIATNCGKYLKEMGIPDHLTCLLRNLYAGQKQQLELDMEQTGSK